MLILAGGGGVGGGGGRVMDHTWSSRSVVEKLVKNRIDNSLLWEYVHACGCTSDFVRACTHTFKALEETLKQNL